MSLSLFLVISVFMIESFLNNWDNLLLFDFKTVTNMSNWSEESDSARYRGSSKASFDLYNTKTRQSAVFFSLLIPISSGACFSGVRTKTQLNLFPYRFISFACTVQGSASAYKIILRHKTLDYPNPSFEQDFQVKSGIKNYIKLPLTKFKPHFRETKLVNGPTLDLTNITNFGIQVASGFNKNSKQSGLSSLFIERIWAKH